MAFGSGVTGPGVAEVGLLEYSSCGGVVPASVLSTITDRFCGVLVEVLTMMVRSWSARMRDQASTPPL